MLKPTKQNLIRLQPGESIIDYIYPSQYEQLEKHFKDPLKLIDLVDEKLQARQSITPINYPFKYIIAVATEKEWPLK